MRRSLCQFTVSACRLCGSGAISRAACGAALRRTPVQPFASTCPATATALTAAVRYAHDAALADAARREIEEESGRTDKPEQPTPPQGWMPERKPGTTTFDLVKRYEGEEITVRYNTNQDSDKANSLDIVVYVTQSNGETMQVDISIEEGELVLNNIRFFDAAAVAKDSTAEGEAKRAELYSGPLVHELNYDLLNSVMSYLEKRGVDEKLGEYIILYSFWAEQLDYEAWLSTMNKFAS